MHTSSRGNVILAMSVGDRLSQNPSYMKPVLYAVISPLISNMSVFYTVLIVETIQHSGWVPPVFHGTDYLGTTVQHSINGARGAVASD